MNAPDPRQARLERPPRWQDPLKLVQNTPPGQIARIVLWSVILLALTLIVWAIFGRLDIVASAEGRLVPQTLVKIVQPAEAGVVKALLVEEGDKVRAGQVLARLDTTLAQADQAGVAADLANQRLQIRRIEALLSGQALQPGRGDDADRFAQVLRQFEAQRKAFDDSVAHETALLEKAEHEKKSAEEVLAKLEQTLPHYTKAAQAYARLEKDGFIGPLASAEKQREATEKMRDLDAQRGTVAALEASIIAQRKRLVQVESSFRNDLQKELATSRERVSQLEPALTKTRFKSGLTELRAPQDGVIKDLATTTVGAVVQPGSVLMTLVPQNEALFADVEIKNEDAGFVFVGQSAKVKLAAYPFQRYGMLTGRVIHVSADASPPPAQSAREASAPQVSAYKARIALDSQRFMDPHGNTLTLTPGMLVVAEVHQGTRTVMEYLLSPVKKALNEAGRER